MRWISNRLVGYLLGFFVVQLVEVSCETGVLLEKKQSDSSWQWLTMYKFLQGTGWSREGVTGSYVVCDIASTKTNHTDSWLVSDIIQSDNAKEVTISLTFTTRECPLSYPYCVTYFKMFALQTDESAGVVTKQTISDGNFTFSGNATASVTWKSGQSAQDNVVNATQALSKKSFYLAFQDIGSCIAIKKVSVTYKYCPSVTSNGVTFNKTLAPALRDKEVNVTGRCLDHASPSKALLIARCLSSGDWTTDNGIVCLCDPGFEMANGKCIGCSSGKYKATLGNHACTSCASHSNPSVSRDQCQCDSGYYRAVNELKNTSCSAPPSKPRDLKTTLASPNVVIVIWSPPITDGERNDVKYDVICRKCISGLCTVACNDVNFWPSNKDLTWSHVTMSSVSALVSYRVTVLAKNGVSDVAGLGYYANQSYVFTIPSLTTGTPTNVSSNFTTTVPTETSTPGSDVSAAIGISVACTFVLCLLIGLIIAYVMIKKYKSRIHQSNGGSRKLSHHSITTCTSDLSTLGDNWKMSSASTVLANLDNHVTANSIPEINIDDVTHEPRDLHSDHSTPEAWVNGKLGTSMMMTDVRKSPIGSSASMRNWFPQSDVQYGI